MTGESNVVLVTGGAGYIGSHILLALRESGISAVVIDDLSTGNRQAIPNDVPLVEGSVGDPDLLTQVMEDYKVAAVLHLAGSVVAPESLRDPLAYYRNNTLNSLTLIEASVRHGINHFINSSTAAVYGVPDISPVPEDAPTRPISPYGMSKLATENILSDAARAHGFHYVTLRYFNAAGADPVGRAGQSTSAPTHLIEVACQVARGVLPKMQVFGDDYPTPDGTCIRDYVHVTDIAAAHIQALNYLVEGGESVTLNCGYGRGHSVMEVLSAFESVTGQAIPWDPSHRRPGDAPIVVARAERIRDLLRWKPQHDDLRTILKTALAWDQQKGNSENPAPAPS